MTKYAVVDIETTGMSAGKDRITEVAIYLHDGEKTIDQFTTLINPECKIPYRITQLTGIDNKLVAGAPRFYEVAKRIVEITEDAVFVAHNVSFDYNFIRGEFRALGYNYERRKLCTVKLSRKLIPGLPSYGLGNLCRSLNIKIESRHRAAGDAAATVKVLELLLTKEPRPEEINLKGLHNSFNKELIKQLPQQTGVYYFHNADGKIIYVGKSINIHDRIIQHFNNTTTLKALEMKQQIADITWEITGSELVALLLESYEIKTKMPVFNRAQRRTLFNWGLYQQMDNEGYIRLKVDKKIKDDGLITTFTGKKSGRDELFRLVEQHNLCQKLCGLYSHSGACFQHSIHECRGACIGEEPQEEYNARVLAAIDRYTYQHCNFFLFGEGRTADESSVVWVENYIYRGFGFFDNNTDPGLELWKASVKRYPDNKDIQTIINGYLRKNPRVKIHFYDPC
jgi:DNA polymerase-3 subunit epsilon